MSNKFRTQLQLDALEARWAPAKIKPALAGPICDYQCHLANQIAMTAGIGSSGFLGPTDGAYDYSWDSPYSVDMSYYYPDLFYGGW